jgi:hypothetical protein
MVDPRVCPPKVDVELADVVRRFGPQYTSQYGHRMMPSHKKALSVGPSRNSAAVMSTWRETPRASSILMSSSSKRTYKAVSFSVLFLLKTLD